LRLGWNGRGGFGPVGEGGVAVVLEKAATRRNGRVPAEA